MMNESLLIKAKNWGFLCQGSPTGNWEILPQQATKRWRLQQAEERWLLLVADVPQINFHPDEAIAFLERRRNSEFNHKLHQSSESIGLI
ncbi:MAG TPA: hypothetical protein V6D50_25260 [Chroococcales cyanobacterium]|jgi:hypothetical protein